MSALRRALGVQCPVVMCFAYSESVQSSSRPAPAGRAMALPSISYIPVSSPVLLVWAAAPMERASEPSVTGLALPRVQHAYESTSEIVMRATVG